MLLVMELTLDPERCLLRGVAAEAVAFSPETTDAERAREEWREEWREVWRDAAREEGRDPAREEVRDERREPARLTL